MMDSTLKEVSDLLGRPEMVPMTSHLMVFLSHFKMASPSFKVFPCF